MRPLRQIILSLRFLCQTQCLARVPHTLHELFCVLDEHYLESSRYAKEAVADVTFLTCHCCAVFSQVKILQSKKLTWRKRMGILNNAEIGSSGSAGHGKMSKMKQAIMLLYYNEHQHTDSIGISTEGMNSVAFPAGGICLFGWCRKIRDTFQCNFEDQLAVL